MPDAPLFQTGTLTANGINIRYHRTGGGKPPLVLSHGITDMGLCWRRVAESLCREYDVIVYDARGHGDSDAPPAGHEPDNRALDLRGLIVGLGLDRPRLLGHSLGATTVALLAANYPSLAHSVVLEDPPFRERLDVEPSTAQRADWQRRWEEWRDYAMPRVGQTCAELEAICRAQSPHWHELEFRPWAEAKTKISPHIFDIPNLNEFDWWQCLPRIRCPALLVSAEPARGALMSREAEVFLRDFCPSITLVRLANAGHNIHRDQFERFIALATDFFSHSTA